jgi:hypothetical protein
MMPERRDDLETVIGDSPARVLPEPAYVIRAEAGVSLGDGDLAIVHDDTDTTLVTMAADRRATAERAGQPFEGPFTVIRLEISLSFQAPGFIAAATGVCAAAGINVFVLSTFSYDYLLVPVADRAATMAALDARGFPVVDIVP